MTMTNSIYTAMSGLLGYSKGLDVISSNITILNTPGFKGTSSLSGCLLRGIGWRQQ